MRKEGNRAIAVIMAILFARLISRAGFRLMVVGMIAEVATDQ